MTYSDICSYPERSFKKYWRRVISDPHFLGVLETFTRIKLPRGRAKVKTAAIVERKKPGGVGKLVAGGKAAFVAAKARLASLSSWVDFQRFMAFLITQLISRTTQGLEVSGISNLEVLRDGNRACFLSSHRSTFLDPAIANLVLDENLGRTAYNAVGDNISKTAWLGDFVRLSRGFIVKRDVPDIDEKLNEAKKLSSYIRDLLSQDNLVWIAHRNGRAKDGRDLTDSAVLSMLKMAAQDLEWGEFADEYRLMPIAMSWELIPLDNLMAQELHGLVSHNGRHRDMMNILTEIRMEKRRVHIGFGARVTAEKRSTLVQEVDKEIQLSTRLWEANWKAWLYEATLSGADEGTRSRAGFEDLIASRVDLSAGNWVLDRAAEVAEETRKKLAAGEFGDQTGVDTDELVEKVRRSLISMYAAPIDLALSHAGSVGELLDVSEALVADTVLRA